jgi:probable phosphoglycerate mutase
VPEPPVAGRLVVVRHGATEWSLAGRHTGTTDVPLAANGEAQARALGKRLAGHGFARVLVSPLARARRTCALAGYGDRAEVVEDLREWGYGEFEGRTTSDIRAERPGWSPWVAGFPGGEPLDRLAERADRVVAAARRAPGDTLAFAHGHILRVVAARWLGLEPSAAASLQLGAGALGVLGWEREVPALGRWDDDGGDPLGS